MKKKSIMAGLIAIALVPLSASADVTFNGFASIVAGIDTEDDNFRNSPYEDEISFKPESKFALQATADLGENLTATAQIMARGSNDFDAQFEWAYISYGISDTHTLRAGKLRLPFYKYSDYLDVGYAYPWIRPPKAMYSLLFSTFEGVSLVSDFVVANWDVSSNISYGNVEDTFFKTTTPTEGKLTGFGGINLQVSKDWFSAYVGYMGGDVNIPHPGMEGLGNLIDAFAPGEGTNVKMDGDLGYFVGTGFTIDYDNWLFNMEWSTVTVEDSLNLENEQWYTSLAYRFGNIMPYITYQQTEQNIDTSFSSSLPGVQLPAQIHPAQPPLNAFVQGAFNGQTFEYSGITLGVRYDFHSNAALKIEYNSYDNIVDLASGVGSIANPSSSGNFSVALDLVF